MPSAIPAASTSDEFDAIGSQRGLANDVGEIRRVLNSFLQMIEQDQSNSLIIAATNHPEILDYALFRRFDDVIEYGLPNSEQTKAVLKNRLANFSKSIRSWDKLCKIAEGLSYAELARAADDAIKDAIIQDRPQVDIRTWKSILRSARLSMGDNALKVVEPLNDRTKGRTATTLSLPGNGPARKVPLNSIRNQRPTVPKTRPSPTRRSLAWPTTPSWRTDGRSHQSPAPIRPRWRVWPADRVQELPGFELAFEGLARGAQRIELLNLRRDPKLKPTWRRFSSPTGS